MKCGRGFIIEFESHREFYKQMLIVKYLADVFDAPLWSTFFPLADENCFKKCKMEIRYSNEEIWNVTYPFSSMKFDPGTSLWCRIVNPGLYRSAEEFVPVKFLSSRKKLCLIFPAELENFKTLSVCPVDCNHELRVGVVLLD